MILIVQQDFKLITVYMKKFLDLGFKEEQLISMIDLSGIDRYFVCEYIDTLVIDSSLYNYSVSNIVKSYENVQVIITDAKESSKTIRLICDKSLSYIDRDTTSEDLKKILTVEKISPLKLVEHF